MARVSPEVELDDPRLGFCDDLIRVYLRMHERAKALSPELVVKEDATYVIVSALSDSAGAITLKDPLNFVFSSAINGEGDDRLGAVYRMPMETYTLRHGRIYSSETDGPRVVNGLLQDGGAVVWSQRQGEEQLMALRRTSDRTFVMLLPEQVSDRTVAGEPLAQHEAQVYPALVMLKDLRGPRVKNPPDLVRMVLRTLEDRTRGRSIKASGDRDAGRHFDVRQRMSKYQEVVWGKPQ